MWAITILIRKRTSKRGSRLIKLGSFRLIGDEKSDKDSVVYVRKKWSIIPFYNECRIRNNERSFVKFLRDFGGEGFFTVVFTSKMKAKKKRGFSSFWYGEISGNSFVRYKRTFLEPKTSMYPYFKSIFPIGVKHTI